MNSFASELWAVVRTVVQAAITEQMVVSLSCAIMIMLSWPFQYLYFGLDCVGSCDHEWSCHQAVKCELLWPVRPPGVGSSDLIGSIERWLSAFSTPAVWNGATRIFCQSDGKAGMKRNPLGMADVSAGFHGAVIVVHITWHPCLWGKSPTYSSILQTVCKIFERPFLLRVIFWHCCVKTSV